MRGSPFPSPSFPLSALPVIPRGFARYQTSLRDTQTTIRTLEGYEVFQDWIESSGLEADSVSRNVHHFTSFVRVHRVKLREAIPMESIAVFLGNVLVQMRSDAGWELFEGSFPSVGPYPHYYEPMHLLQFIWDADEATLEIGLRKIEEWAAAPPQ